MTRSHRLLAASVAAVASLAGCRDSASPAASPSFQLSLPESPGFHQRDDGLWEWNGLPPQDDLGPATIIGKSFRGEAPGTGWRRARIVATMDFAGEEGKHTISYSVVHAPTASVLDASQAGQGWGRDDAGSQPICRPASRDAQVGVAVRRCTPKMGCQAKAAVSRRRSSRFWLWLSRV